MSHCRPSRAPKLATPTFKSRKFKTGSTHYRPSLTVGAPCFSRTVVMLYLGMAHVDKAIPALISLLGYRQDLGLPTKGGSSHQESRFGHLVSITALVLLPGRWFYGSGHWRLWSLERACYWFRRHRLSQRLDTSRTFERCAHHASIPARNGVQCVSNTQCIATVYSYNAAATVRTRERR